MQSPATKHLLLSLLWLCLWCPTKLIGEGSVNFINYPGHRLFYNASADQQLKIYGGAGEFINVGASHVGIRGGFIQVYRPDGTLHSTFDGNDGLAIINNNVEELNGPNGGGTTNGTGYIPGIVAIQEGEAGIWTIVLDFPEHNFNDFQNILNDASWTRTNDQPTNRRVVLAWDITISKGGAGNEGGSFQTGRVYSNEYVSMINRNGTTTSPVFYVLSKGGFQYRLNFNQTDPFGFPLSANNLGVVTGNQKPTYQSASQGDITTNLDFENWQDENLYLYPPQAQDSLSFINHKLFFNPPDPTMPPSAVVTEVYGPSTHTTWLYTAPRPVSFEVSSLSEKVETAQSDTTFNLSNQFLHFESNQEGMVQARIDVDGDGNFQEDVDVFLSKFTHSGKDSILWDGMDGFGNPLPINQDTNWTIQWSLQAGEVHIFNQDVENDLGGLTITRINGNNSPITEFFYDHSSVGGIVSGGGTPKQALPTTTPFTYSNNFGNQILFDYWAYTILERQNSTLSINIELAPTYLTDRDKDGILDNLDDDDDNDGIPDVVELCTTQIDCPFLIVNPNGDEDGDGIENFLDADDSNFQLNCTTLTSKDSCGVFPIWMDADLDGIPNFLDSDSDNDNILDDIEGSEDADMDNIPNFLDNDSDNDGIIDEIETTEDTDMDSIPNFLDDDSDNDGILDDIEGSKDVDMDSIPNFLDNDSDNDGILDGLETSEDVDKDSIPNFLDNDSDNDGILDNLETSEDADKDGIPNFLDNDSDNDSILDGVEGSEDVDMDSIPNFLDSDSDNDGILDSIEGSEDVDMDSIPNFLDNDSDNDGILDGLDGSEDIDMDSIPNFLDSDSDNDGIPDSIEINQDFDLDSIPNFLDNDSDNDGIRDGIEGSEDVDMDSIPNFLDNDSDNDNILDGTEGSGDVDMDSIPNFLDDDSDNDSILDEIEGSEDVDMDSIPNFLDSDSDNDGIPDSIEINQDFDLDTIPNFLDQDSDNDGIRDAIEGSEDVDMDSIPNFLDNDSDNDNILDELEGSGDVDMDNLPNFLDDDSDNDSILDGLEGSEDVDMDSIPNFLDSDSDNDGIPDSIEINQDFDLDTIPNFLDDDSDNDGIRDGIEGSEDVDMDSIPNFLDDDSDNDSILDGIEGSEDIDMDSIPNFLDDDSDNDSILDGLEGSEDVDMDSIPNFLDSDSDNDGIPDSIEINQDFDLDTIPNFLDQDSDNDGILDGIEGSEDSDEDGVPNYLDDDSDNDEISDMLETDTDTDDDGIPDFLDRDSDNDAIPDAIETNIDTDSDGIPNNLDLDSDNDGINDVKEIGATDNNGDGQADGEDSNEDGLIDNPPAIKDSDNDSIPNHLDLDSDNDGVLDIIENGNELADQNGDGMADGLDEDGDGISSTLDDNDNLFGEENDPPSKNTDDTDEPDFLDIDSDNDGETDISENGNGDVDKDGDGMIDPPIVDNDKDGISSPFDQNPTVFGNFNDFDIDADGIANLLDLDDDNDGITDSLELCGNLSNCPFATIDPAGDEDGDGILNLQDASDENFRTICVDADEDGICDYPPVDYDSDQDNVPNHLDLDSDNDGISDVTEAGFLALDTTGNGRIDGSLADFGINGLYLNLPTDTIADTDGDGVYNFVDIDSDNDGIFDVREGQYAHLDADNNGRLDNTSRALEVNDDGVGDVLEGGNFKMVVDSDGDKAYNAVDLDSDNDGIGDVIEGGATLRTTTDGVGDVIEGGNPDADRDGFIGTSALIVTPFGQPITDAVGLSFIPYSLPADSDNDGVYNFIDADSDNDGIGDVIEGSSALKFLASLEGIGDVIEGGNLSFDFDGDGFIGSASDLIINNLGQPIQSMSFVLPLNASPVDSDGDGFYNAIDADSDNDGVGDVIEGGTALRTTTGGVGDVIEGGNLDLDKDGFVGTSPLNYNALGQPISDSTDLIFNLNSLPLDTDGDGVFNFIDHDSDNDGIGDVIEGGSTNRVTEGGIGDVIEGGNLDRDRDGFLGTSPLIYNSLGQPIGDSTDLKFLINTLPLDTDLDGVLNMVDLDSDNDGIGDVIEGMAALSRATDTGGVGDVIEGGSMDFNRDGFLGTTSLVTNEMGQPIGDDSNFIFNLNLPPIDSDGDGVFNFIDSDSDNDGIGDVIEGGSTNRVAEDGIGDVIEGGNDLSLDFNNNGFMGGLEVTTNDFGQPIQSMSFLLPINNVPIDTDEDGIDDNADLDSDDDGINDVLEAGGMDADRNGLQDGDSQPSGSMGTFLDIQDFDQDSIPDFLDLDVDGDGIFDLVENGGQASDQDRDGRIDGIDTDQDGIKDLEDGLPNEFGDTDDGNLQDTDGDGIPDVKDADTDNDGISDEIEIANALNNGDTDKDGIPDYRDLDSDNDGINDVREIELVDANGDGLADGEDSDQDGIIDTPIDIVDSDRDSIPNHLDLDSDNDGVLDIVENGNGLADENGDGMADGTDADGDGIPSSLDDNDDLFGEENDSPLQNTDGTDNPDITDDDSDNDGITDIAAAGYEDADQDGDGMADPPFIDKDKDGIPSSLDENDFVFGNFNKNDKDGDGIIDSLDRDDDNDSILDSIEICQNLLNCPLANLDPSGDSDQDSIPNYLDANDSNFRLGCTDADADGECDFLPSWLDSDQDNVPNHLDLDADNDGYSDISENGQQVLDGDNNGRLDSDPLMEFTTLDADQDGVYNFLDIDSDNDGIYDIQEDTLRIFDADNNGRIDNTSRTPQVDNNGVPTILNEQFPFPLDTDRDQFYNAIDLDADNDGIGDVIEGGNTDFDQNGFAGSTSLLINEYGALLESLTGSSFEYLAADDKDEDGVPNFLDHDSDNDGIGDVIEGGNPDPDKNGFLGGGELILNEYGQVITDGNATAYQPNNTELDTDEDGVYNYLDLDSDNDGIGDVIEGGNPDPDKNGFLGTSPFTINELGQILSDADNVLYDLNPTPPAHDNDAIHSFVDFDADNDGIGDVIEGGNPDPDKNGFLGTSPLITNYWGQVIGDTMGVTYTPNEIPLDSESDSYYNFIDADSDNDGIGDVIEGGNPDSDGNGYIGTDPIQFDVYGTPMSDTTGLTFTPFEVPLDFDGDIAYDYLDLDADDDGINDILEGGGLDLNGDAFQDGTVTARGIVDVLLNPADTDFDGHPDFLDIDSDSDGIVDILENGCGISDVNGDGLVDGTDTDIDGIKDLVDGLILVFGDEEDKGLLFSDVDALADFIDLDSDGDGIWDVAENGWAAFDQDGNGILDFLEDANNDGIADTIPLPYSLLDTDGDLIPNHIDTDSDGDQFTDLEECPTPQACPDFDQDGIPDYLDSDCNQLSIPNIQLLASETSVCAGSSIQLTAINTQPSPFAVSYEWTDTNELLISESDSQADTFAITLSAFDKSTEGYYRFAIQSQQGSCAAKTDSIFIQVIDETDIRPTLSIDQDTICSGSTIVLSAVVLDTTLVDEYNWYVLENDTRKLLETSTTPMLSLSNFEAIEAVDFQVEATNIKCGSQLSNNQTLYIYDESRTVAATPSVSLAEPLCLGSSVQLIADFMVNASYQWITPKGNTISDRVLNLTTLSAADEGRYFAIVTIGNCFSTTTQPIEIAVTSIEDPIIEPVVESCKGGTITLQIQNPIPNAQYEWYQENGTLMTQTDQPNFLLTTNLQEAEAIRYYAIAITETCASNASQSVLVPIGNPVIEAAFGGENQTVCNQNTIQLNATMPRSGTGVWQTLNGNTIGTAANPTVPLQTGANTFVWTVQVPQCNASSSDTILIENMPKPTITAFAGTDKTICLEQSTQLSAQNLPVGIQGNWQSLNAATISPSNTSITTIQNLQEGNNIVVWTLSTNECPAFSQDSIVITSTLPPNEIAKVGEDKTICEETALVLNATPTSESTGQWTSLSGNQIFNPTNPVSIVGNLQGGDNILVWTLSTEQCGDYSSDTLLIEKTTPPNEEAIAGVDQQICMENTIQLSANQPNIATGVWATNQPLSFENNTSAFTTISDLQEGSNLLIWSLSFENCLNYDSDTLEIIKETPPTEIANAGIDQQVCDAESIQLNAQQGAISKGEWLLAGNYAIENTQQPNTSVINLFAGETYEFIWSLSTDFCTDFSQDTVQVVIDAIPNITATIRREEFESTPSPTQPAMDVVFCDPNSILLEAILPENIEGQWQTNNQVELEQLSDGMAFISNIEDEELQFIWTLSQNSCTNFSADTLDIEIFKADGLVANQDKIELFFNESITEIDLLANDRIPENMEWTFEVIEEGEGKITNLGEGFIDYTPRTNFFGEDVFIYQLCHAQCPELCDTTQISFQVKGINKDETCFVPNIITPNGDGANDAFTVPCLTEYPDHQVTIFNRWGDEVFRAAPYKNNWEGTYKFSPLPPGTYFYVIALTNDPMEQLSGYFTIVR